MKTILLVLVLTAFTLTGAEQKTPQNTKVQQTVQQSNAASKKNSNAFANLQKPVLENPQSWTMVVVPDIQAYICKWVNHGILNMMCAWIVYNKKALNIRQVLFTGDLVYQNNIGKVRHNKHDLVCEEQWQAVSRLISRLDGRLPYILCTGNHDYGISTAENRHTFFNDYFKSNRNPLTREQLIECNKNTFNMKTMENAAFEFTAPYPDGRKFLVITVPFAPTKQQLAWTLRIANDPRFTDHFGIILTHSYMYGNGERIKKEKYKLSKEGGAPGEGIYQHVVKKSKNIRMVVCGHMAAPDRWDKSVGYSETVNGAGKKVAQMLFNTQAIGGGFYGSGGDGWLRLLEFMPDGKTIKARTFSPMFAASPSTCHLAWKTDARNEFTFTLE